MPKPSSRSSSKRCSRAAPARRSPQPDAAAGAEVCSILHLEDDPLDAEMIESTLAKHGVICRWQRVCTRAEFAGALHRRDFDLILGDLSLPQLDGWAALEMAQAACPEVPFIFLSGKMTRACTALSFARGAVDCVSKDDLALLAPSVRRVIHVLRERHERRHAEEERDRFFNLSGDLLCVLDVQGNFQRVNPSLERALDLAAHELEGKPILGLVHPEDGAATTKCLGLLREAGALHHFENRLRVRDGSYLWLQWTATAVPERGTIYANARDVTERRKAEEAARQSEARTRAIVESALDCVIAVDAQGRIVEFNPAAEKTFGYPRSEVVGLLLAEMLIPEALRTAQQGGLARYLESGESRILGRRIEATAKRRDGSEFPIELAVSQAGGTDVPQFTAYLRDITERKIAETEIQKLAAFPRLNPQPVLEFSATGALTYFNDAAMEMARAFGEAHPSGVLPADTAAVVARCLATRESHPRYETRIAGRTLSWSFYPIPASQVVHGYATDITDRKQAEEQLREQAALLDKAQDAIVVRDLNHRILFWSKGAEHLFGWTSAEAIGRNAIELLSQPEGERFLDALRLVLEKGEWSGEQQQRTRAGKLVDVQSRWTLVRDDQGHPKSVLVLSTDITEKKQLETQFLRAQRLESIGSLASGVAHDLNNILAPILMSVNLLQETLTDAHNTRLLETLRVGVQRGADMVKQILTFTRGQGTARGAVQLRHLVGEISRIAGETFSRKIRIQTTVAKDLWPIMADATQMHQVLMNLCVNARDAMPEGGTLAITAENIRMETAPPELKHGGGAYVLLTVADTGSGMSPEVLARIWEPFFTTKPQGQGTGLGLPTVLNIVKTHGGFVRTESEPGRGTSFRIFLPATESSQVPAPVEPVTLPPQGQGEQILVIDDERAFLEITKLILQKHGYRVLTAGDGAEALALFAQHQGEIDLVMTDMIMPFLDGPATIRALRSIKPSVLILATSGLSENEKTAGDLAGATFLPKPFTTECLLATVDRLVHSSPARRGLT